MNQILKSIVKRHGFSSRFSSNRNICSMVLGRQIDGVFDSQTLSCINAATQFNHPVVVCVIGNGEKIRNANANISHIIEIKSDMKLMTETYTNIINKIIEKINNSDEKNENFFKNIQKPIKYIVAPTTDIGKDVIPRLGGIRDIQPITDIIKINKAGESFLRPMYAGNAIAEVAPKDEGMQLLTVRPTCFQSEELERTSVIQTEYISKDDTLEGATQWISDIETKKNRPDLGSSSIVVSGGRALKSAESFEKILIPLAAKLNAAVGASRAAVDGGFVGNDMQIGQTGKIVSPSLYFAVGISGAIQHISGIKDSKVIVAINSDADAPIFEIADYGLVGDLFNIVPELTEKLPQL